MTARIAISGFGRIGRLVLRGLVEQNRHDVEIVAVNNTSPIETNAHLLKYDSVHGRFNADITTSGNILSVNGKKITCLQERDPEQINWKELGVDIVMECSGKFTKRADAAKHFKGGAKKVLISAPGSDDDLTVVYGVNHDQIRREHTIVSNASCTTNCLAPMAYVLNKEIGIERGFMTTIHAYTSDQNIHDGSHKDLHRARAAALSMIPTSTGAAQAVGKVLPELQGKLDGVAIRVPTANVSLVDFKFNASRATSADEIAAIMKRAAEGPMKNIISVYDEKLVSVDFNHDPHSVNFALRETKVLDGNFVRVMAWYDNEWAFSLRMLDTAAVMHQAGY